MPELPVVSGREARRAFERLGWTFRRQAASPCPAASSAAVFRVVRGSAAGVWRLTWRGVALIRPRLEGPATLGEAQQSTWTPAADV